MPVNDAELEHEFGSRNPMARQKLMELLQELR